MDSHSNIIKNQAKRTDITKKKTKKKIIGYLGLGSNIGDSISNVKLAITKIHQIKHTKVIEESSLYQSKAWGNTNQNDFINSVIKIKTKLSPEKLLEKLLKVESGMGRVRKEKWGPRIIDIDILLYGDSVVEKPHLSIPHPYITERKFVLIPLYELNPQLNIPNKGNLSDFICDDVLKNSELEIKKS